MRLSFPKAAVSHKTTGNHLPPTFGLFHEETSIPRVHSGFLTQILLHEGFVVALHDVVAEVSLRNQVTSIEGARGQFLCNFRVALDKGKTKLCHISQIHLPLVDI